MFYGFSSVKCGTSGILPVSRREQNEVDDFSKSTALVKLCLVCKQIHSKIKWTKYRVLKAIAHRVRNFRMHFSVFSYSPSFPIKMHATDAKTQKIEPDPNFFWRTKVSEAVSKRVWHNVRSYLFFNVREFWTKISDSVCRDLYWGGLALH